MTDLEIRQLLLDCGFESVPAPATAHWAVVRKGLGGAALHVTCVRGARGGLVLLVPTERECILVAQKLAQHGAGRVDVRAERMEPRWPWLASRVGVGAFILVGWAIGALRLLS